MFQRGTHRGGGGLHDGPREAWGAQCARVDVSCTAEMSRDMHRANIRGHSGSSCVGSLGANVIGVLSPRSEVSLILALSRVVL